MDLMGFHEKQMLKPVSMRIFVRYSQKGEHDDHHLYLGKCLGHIVFSMGREGGATAAMFCIVPQHCLSPPLPNKARWKALSGQSKDFHLPVVPNWSFYYGWAEINIPFSICFIANYSFPFWSGIPRSFILRLLWPEKVWNYRLEEWSKFSFQINKRCLC